MPIAVYSAAEAQQNLRSNRTSMWPGKRANSGARLGLFATVAMKPSFQFVPGESVFTIGSCFAREIEGELQQRGFDLPMTKVQLPAHESASSVGNDILNKYIAHSMANELRWALDPDAAFPEAAFLEVEPGLWHDPHLAHNLKPASLERVRERRADVMAACESARTARVFVVTLGLAEAWFDQHVALYLNGTPPSAAFERYPGRFELHVLSHADILESLADMHRILTRHGRSDFRMLVTVSPVPFKASFSGQDALAANCYSKSVQRAAVEEFVIAHDNVDYFPSYEIVTLGERSSSFMPDNIHVQRSVVSRIVGQVVQAYMPETADPRQDAPAAAVEKTEAEHQPTTPAQLYQAALDSAKAGDHTTAWNRLRSISESLGPDACGVPAQQFHFEYGMCLLRCKQVPEAERELRAAAALDPADSRAAYNHGLALARLGQRNAAIKAFKSATRSDPESVVYAWRLGVEWLRSGDTVRARAAIDRALSLDPKHEDSIKTRAEIDALEEESSPLLSPKPYTPPARRPVVPPAVSKPAVPGQTVGPAAVKSTSWWTRLFGASPSTAGHDKA